MKGLRAPAAEMHCADCNFHGVKVRALAYYNLAPLCASCLDAAKRAAAAQRETQRALLAARAVAAKAEREARREERKAAAGTVVPVTQPSARCGRCRRARQWCICVCHKCLQALHRGPCKGTPSPRAKRAAWRGVGEAVQTVLAQRAAQRQQLARVAPQERAKRLEMALGLLVTAVQEYLDYSDHANRMEMKAQQEAARVELQKHARQRRYKTA